MKRKTRLLLLLTIPLALSGAVGSIYGRAAKPSDWIDISTRGAVSGSNSTSAIQSAIDEVSLSGGGTVYFPRGNYFVDQINLKSNVTLSGNHAPLTLIRLQIQAKRRYHCKA